MFHFTSTVPTAPPAEVIASDVTPTSITFHWLEPPCGHRHGHIISYSILLRSENDDILVNSERTTTSITVGDLIPYTTYYFTISASTVVGEGPSHTLAQRTKQIGTFFTRMSSHKLQTSFPNTVQCL